MESRLDRAMESILEAKESDFSFPIGSGGIDEGTVSFDCFEQGTSWPLEPFS